jgi:hypothetical protein
MPSLPRRGALHERTAQDRSAIRASYQDGVLPRYHEQITARVAALRPSAIQVNVAHGPEMDPALFDGYIHLTRHGLSSTRHTAEPGQWIPGASDIEERLQSCSPQMRQAMGLESSASVSATLGDLRGAAGLAPHDTGRSRGPAFAARSEWRQGSTTELKR